MYVVCAAVFSVHVAVCAFPMCDHSQGGYFPPNKRRGTVFRVLFQQTNKQTNKVLHMKRLKCYKLALQRAVPGSRGWKSSSHSRDGTTTSLLSRFSTIWCTMLWDEYVSRVYHNEFSAWKAQRAGEWQNPQKIQKNRMSSVDSKPKNKNHPQRQLVHAESLVPARGVWAIWSGPVFFWLFASPIESKTSDFAKLDIWDIWYEIGHLRCLIWRNLVSDVRFPTKRERIFYIRERRSGPVFWWKLRTSNHGHGYLWTATHTHMTAVRHATETFVCWPLYSFSQNSLIFINRIG